MATQRIRIFISSPGDVGQERLIASRIIDRLQGRFAGIFQLEAYFWEDKALPATKHFEESIESASNFDIAIFMLWSRLGTVLPTDKYAGPNNEPVTGTEFEFLEARAASMANGFPDLLVYRKNSKRQVELDFSKQEELQRDIEQHAAVSRFIDRWFKNPDGTFKAAFFSYETNDHFEDALENHLADLLQKRIPQHLTDGVETSAVVWTRGSPFRGLKPFEADHASIFFGRTRAIGLAQEALVGQAENGCAFLLVLGMSGVGKSSFMRAGLMPAVTHPGVVEDVEFWRSVVFRPSALVSNDPSTFDPVLALANALMSAIPELGILGVTPQDVARAFESPVATEEKLRLAFSAAGKAESLASLTTPPVGRLLVAVDQLEEMFSLSQFDAARRDAFVRALSSLACSGRAWVIATMRSDLYPRLAEIPRLAELKSGTGQFDLSPPTPIEIRQMIRKPAIAAGLHFEVNRKTAESLEDILQAAAEKDPESLPLLEFTLDELFNSRAEGNILTFFAYEALGGMEGAIARRAEEVFKSVSLAAQDALPRLLQKLVSPLAEGATEANPTARPANLEQLRENADTGELTEALVEAHLLTTDRGPDNQPIVSLTHEALLRMWPRAKAWVDQNRDLLAIRGRVSVAAQRWRESDYPADLLLGEGKPLIEANTLLKALGAELSEMEAKLIAKSNSRQRKRTALKRGAVATLAVLTVVATGMALYARAKKTEAEQNAVIAEKKKEEAVASEARAQVELDEAKKGVHWIYANLLGLRRLSGDELRASAIDWVKDQANNKHTSAAEHILAWFYEVGLNVPQDMIEARRLYLAAADQGNAQSQSDLAYLCQNGFGGPMDFSRAWELDQQAAKLGEKEAMDRMGQMLAFGLGRKEDDAQALYWFKQALALRHPTALIRMQTLKAFGKGAPEDYRAIFNDIQAAANGGDYRSKARLGFLYENGIGTAQDFDLARICYLDAAQHNIGDAMVCMGALYEYGHGVPQDFATARQWYEKTASEPDEIADAYVQGDANRRLGLFYQRGQGVQQDGKRAMEYFVTAADLAQSEDAKACMARLYDEGSAGFPPNETLALECYQYAAEEGNGSAMYEMGRRYLAGRGVPKDLQEAVNWFRRAVWVGSADGWKWLHDNGVSVVPEGQSGNG